MKTYCCTCGNTLFFDNTLCSACGRAAGWCESCEAVVGLDPLPGGGFTCPQGHALSACDNKVHFEVCNRFCAGGPGLCKACTLNRTVPDQSVPGNRASWARLEAAKRRMIYDLKLIGCGIDRLHALENNPPLRFDFKAEITPTRGYWRPMNDGQPVYTGHDDGVITINLKETDSVEREKTRVNLGEPQRTLVGHFRHEIGHYVYDALIANDPNRKQTFMNTFGDPDAISYSDALEKHYNTGPPADWRDNFVSSYATMHPWEDWAETWHAYLHIAGTLDTLGSHGWIGPDCLPPFADFDQTVKNYVKAGVALNETARDSGLLPLASENLPAPVVEKLRCTDYLITK